MATGNRESILAQIHSLELGAEIAIQSRNEDLRQFIQSVIDEGWSDFVEINENTFTTDIRVDIPSIAIVAKKPNKNHMYARLMIEFNRKCNDGLTIDEHVSSGIYFSGIDYKYINAFSQEKRMLELTLAFANKVDSLDSLVNSEMFKMYENDILALYKAKNDLQNLDETVKKERIEEISSMFTAGQVINRLNDLKRIVCSYSIRKVTPKRIYLDGYCDAYGYERKSCNKHEAAVKIYNNEWAIA